MLLFSERKEGERKEERNERRTKQNPSRKVKFFCFFSPKEKKTKEKKGVDKERILYYNYADKCLMPEGRDEG